METKLTYQDCLDLKEAGFPQDNSDNELLHPPFCTGWEPGNKCTREDQVRNTTLGELIEACGEYFHSVLRIADDKWLTIGFKDKFHEFERGSAIKAVKELYCAINKK